MLLPSPTPTHLLSTSNHRILLNLRDFINSSIMDFVRSPIFEDERRIRLREIISTPDFLIGKQSFTSSGRWCDKKSQNKNISYDFSINLRVLMPTGKSPLSFACTASLETIIRFVVEWKLKSFYNCCGLLTKGLELLAGFQDLLYLSKQ